MLNLSMRSILATPPPLSVHEIIPENWALQKDQLALSSKELPGYFYLAPIGFYVPELHRILVNAVVEELKDFTKIHGTIKGYNSKCRRPLCKRAGRIHRNSTRLEKATRRRVMPQYASTDPLLHALTLYAETFTMPNKENVTDKYPALVR